MEAAEPLPKATLAQVADHIEHVRKVAGVDHVGLGGDFDGNDDWPGRAGGRVEVSRTCSPSWSAAAGRDADLRKLAGGNMLRVLRQAEAVATRLRARAAGVDRHHRGAGRRAARRLGGCGLGAIELRAGTR